MLRTAMEACRYSVRHHVSLGAISHFAGSLLSIPIDIMTVQPKGHVQVANSGQKTWECRRLACIGAGKMLAIPGVCQTLT